MTTEEREKRNELQEEYGQVWDTEQMQKDFDVQSYLSPVTIVIRKFDGVRGTLLFARLPRLYYGFKTLRRS